jgi:hypothetical protein
VWKRHLAAKGLFIVFSFIVLSVAYYYNFRRFPRSSDDANSLLAGYDMSNGNWRLNRWWMPEDNFLTIDMLSYPGLIKCLGFNPYIMFYLPAMLWAGVAVLSVLLAQGGLARSKTLAVATVATLILLPVTWNNGAFLISHAQIHVGTILFVLLCFLLVKKVMSGQSTHWRLRVIVYTSIMVLAVFGDPLAIFIGAIPVIAVAAFSALYGRDSGPLRMVLVATIVAVGLGKILLVLNSLTGGFEPSHLEMRFVSFNDLDKNVAWALQYFLTLFGCDFFGKDLFASPLTGAVLPLIRLPFLALLIVALYRVGKECLATVKAIDRQWPALENDYLDALLAAALTIDVLAAVFSTQIVNATTIRYLFPALVFGAILIARRQIVTRWLGPYLYLALSASLASSLVFCWQRPRRAVLVPKEIEAVSSWLSHNDLRYGFGPYWSSSIVTAATKDRVKIRALISDGAGRLKPFAWMADKTWYQSGATSGTKAIFVLVREEESSYSEADVIRALGEPRDRYQVGPYIIDLYDPGSERLRSLCPPAPTVSSSCSHILRLRCAVSSLPTT